MSKLTTEQQKVEDERPDFRGVVEADGEYDPADQRKNLLDSLSYAWAEWDADDPRWQTILTLLYTVSADTGRQADLTTPLDRAWSAVMQSAVRTIDDAQSREGGDIFQTTMVDSMHGVLATAERMIELATMLLRGHAEMRERQLAAHFGDLIPTAGGWIDPHAEPAAPEEASEGSDTP